VKDRPDRQIAFEASTARTPSGGRNISRFAYENWQANHGRWAYDTPLVSLMFEASREGSREAPLFVLVARQFVEGCHARKQQIDRKRLRLVEYDDAIDNIVQLPAARRAIGE